MKARSSLLLVLTMSLGCRPDPVTWSDVIYSAPDSTGPLGSSTTVPDSLACRATVRSFAVRGKNHVVWWSVRSDSSAVLKYSSAIAGSWKPAISLDTTDRSRRGCRRPAPAIAADHADRLYAAYFLEQSSGPGIFFAHRMDESGFHDPVSIAYGKRPSEVSLAIDGDRVAVAYEEPNAERGQIWVALSSSMGHLFEYRGPVSGASELSGHPEAELHRTKLDVSWVELIQSDSSGRTRRARITGIWK